MYDFETLVSELLHSRPELKRDELMRRIEDKKKTVGAGYLTDQGALFLVAGELGVSLRKEEASSDMRIKDLYIGANDVTIVARVLAVYPEATFNKKDGGTGRYRRLVLFDGTQVARLTVWEEAMGPLEELGLAADNVVRVSNGYVKQGLDGKPNLNLGRRGKIEMVRDEKVVSKLPPLSSATKKLPRLSKEEQFVALECVVTSEPRYSEFVRSDGSEGSLFQFGVAGDGGRETRVVVWSPSAQPELKRGQKVLITNVKARRSSNGEYEVHGDAGSEIVANTTVQKTDLRVAAVSSGRQVKVVFGLDPEKKVRIVELGKDVLEPRVGDVIRVTSSGPSSERIYCRAPEELEVIEAESFPGFDSLVTKLQDAKTEDSQIMVEVIALSHGSVEDIKLKDGTSVKKGELVVGDDTGELKLVGWRDLADRVSGIQPGQRLRVVGASPKTQKVGGWVLQLSSLSEVEKLRGA